MEQGTAETVTTVLAAVPAVSGITFNYDLTITAGVLLAIVSGLIAWIRSRGKAIDDKIAAQDERLGRHESRIASTEQTLNHMPAKADVHALQMTVERMSGDLREIRTGLNAAAERTQRQENVVQRVEEYLLKERAR